ncbi:hypothetical protein RAB70_06490 [Xanthomonas sontii]|uniref:hypothetical protein n=1 Tax=Xanthomonas sontii TaxID=2650745 RepID=UPI0011E76873|nr:hypothetical protein [Xanthomonas sontii]MDQ7758783.1 hypothetical protein [Xanthomonas sontii]UZK05843.1 hypothetical protein CJ027_003260 [Xanthomonas sontii]
MRWFLLGQRTIRLFFRNVKHRKKKESIYLCPMCLRIARPKTKDAGGCGYSKPDQPILPS